MPAGDLFKRTLDAGSSFLDLTRERAEAVVKEWVESGDLGKARAQKAVDQLLDRSRQLTGDLREMIRREIREQILSLGVATKDDVARVEARLETAGVPSAPAGPSPGVEPGPAQAAPVKKAAEGKPVRKASTSSAPAAATKRASAPARKAPSKPASRAPASRRGEARKA